MNYLMRKEREVPLLIICTIHLHILIASYNKGPNYIWHIDGYDKLSPFGLTIHGCIDG